MIIYHITVHFLSTGNNLTELTVKKNDGVLKVGNEIIARFSFNGRLWSTDEEEVIWREL